MISPSQSSFLRSGTVVVPANQSIPLAATGQFFLVKEADAVFRMSFNDGSPFDIEVGLGFRLAGNDQFTRLQFYNDTASAITITFYVGVGEVRDARLNTIIDRLVVVGMKDIPDYSRGNGGTALAAGSFRVVGASTLSFSGTDAATGKQRKQIVVQNCDSGYIWVLDGSGRALYRIGPGESWTIQSSATFGLTRDPAGGNQNALICETFYNS